MKIIFNTPCLPGEVDFALLFFILKEQFFCMSNLVEYKICNNLRSNI